MNKTKAPAKNDHQNVTLKDFTPKEETDCLLDTETNNYLPYSENNLTESDTPRSKAELLEEDIYENHHHHNEKPESKLLQMVEKACHPLIYPLEKFMPVERFPELSFFIIVCLFFMATDFILTVVSVMSIYTHLSHVLIGITVISWGSSAIEMINLTIASKKGEMQLGLTSILSAIVLTFLTIMPLGFIFKMSRRNSHEIDVLQTHHTSGQLFIPVLLVTLVVAIVFWKTNMKLGKCGAYALIVTYFLYIFWVFLLYFGEKD